MIKPIREIGHILRLYNGDAKIDQYPLFWEMFGGFLRFLEEKGP
jgi:hypothetical protein